MNDLFLRVCRGEPVERLPVWMMRQAGRYLPEYRAVRAKVDFLTLCKTPELACEVTLQPVELMGVDAAILFADILLPLEAMGAELKFVKGDGPTFPDPVRSRDDIARLREPDVEETLGYVFDTLRLIRRELDGRVPLLGFAGTPWTLAAYLVEGGGSKHFAHLLSWSYRDPRGLAVLLDKVADVSIAYLRGQIEAGAQALQLFDTWGGLLSVERWNALARPPLEKILTALRGTVPLTYFVQGASHLLPTAATLPVDVLSVDWRQPLSEVRKIAGGTHSPATDSRANACQAKVLQGNLDPAALLGPPEEIRTATERVIEEGRGGGHIVNLGHGILPMTSPDHARVFIDTVKERSGAIRAEGRKG